MIVLLPVSRFRVPYETARGRPYSKLEHMVLRAAGDGGTTLRDLSRSFRVHERLLVEAVVTLVNAGWVAVTGGTEATFVLTAAGDVASRTGKDPVSVVVTPARPAIVVLDRVTGQVARHSEAPSYRRDELGDAWHTAALIRQRIYRSSVDEAQVQKLLPRMPGEWIRRIGRVEETSRNTHYLPIDADPDSGQVRGLPSAWHRALAQEALAAARETARDGEEPPGSTSRPPAAGRRRFLNVAPERPAPSDRETRLDVSPADVVAGTEAHDAVMEEAFRVARTSIAVVVPHVPDQAAFTRLTALAADAVRQGVRVDLLVGQTSPQLTVDELVSAANAAGYDANPRNGRARLRTRAQATGSGASLIVYDHDDGLRAVLGDHHWVGGPTAPGNPVSLRIVEPSVCADLARAVASLWSGRSGREADQSAAAERWRALAAEAEEQAAVRQAQHADAPPQPGGGQAPGATAVELLIDDENAGAPSEESAYVGVSTSDASAGEAGQRGVRLRLTGEGAVLVQRARAATGPSAQP